MKQLKKILRFARLVIIIVVAGFAVGIMPVPPPPKRKSQNFIEVRIETRDQRLEIREENFEIKGL